MPRHPGEQHIRNEATAAIMDHFTAAETSLSDIMYTYDWAGGQTPGRGNILATYAPDGSEVARFEITVNVTKIGTPPPVKPREPELLQGSWADVKLGYFVTDPHGKSWEVIGISGSIRTIRNGDEIYKFSPDMSTVITYCRGCL